MEQHLHLPRLTLATKVTITRILGVPLFIVVLIYYLLGLSRGEENAIERMVALTIFVAVALTDALDGYLARSRNEVTDLGRLLDPIADKALLLSGLILLTRPSLPALAPQIPVWFTALLISRDVFLVLGSTLIYVLAGRLRVQPRFSGKVATVFQMATIIWVLIGGAARTFNWFVGLAAVLTTISWLQYTVDGARQLAHVQHGSPPRTPPTGGL
ncbi:MAG: CDP-alcohol phosphatidyltransferase family protein [Kiritimatiellaeota bacterium]|nr:CDP-alcohol phosphatidyltransferase family protein [Kiritimatiellota bacterium]